MEYIELKIKGMTCEHCASGISKKFEGKDGIINKNISYPDNSGKFEFDPQKISKSEIIDLINNTGYYTVVGEINNNSNDSSNHYDLIIIGGGSAAFSGAIKSENLGVKTLMINGGLDLGGTCVNVGCVPSKNLIRAGETAFHAKYSNFEGIKPKGVDIDFGKIIRDKKKLVSSLQELKYLNVVKDFKNLTILEGWAEFKDDKTILVNNEKEFTASKFLIATGARPYIPDITGIKNIDYLTNISLFNLETQPKSMIILGGGYIALEIAQAYSRLGTEITILQRASYILSKQTEDISEELTKHLVKEGIKINTGIKFIKVSQNNSQIEITTMQNGLIKNFKAEKLLIATGTSPNTNKLGLEKTDLILSSSGHIKVNDKMETNLSHIFAAGDVVNTFAYVYTAALEGKIAVENAFAIQDNKIDYSYLPWVVFTDPQVAGVGIDEKRAKKLNIPFEVSKIELKDVPRAIAANNTKGFIKLIRNKNTNTLIGARIVATEGGELIPQLSMAIKYGISVKDLAENLYPYLTLSEGIKLAAITFGKDVSKLSCCAS